MPGKSKPSLTIIILTYNETIHIERCLKSIAGIAESIIIIDSFSTDNTLDIARSLGAVVYQNPFVNQAVQFQWGLDNCVIVTDWVMRLDADEYVTEGLVCEMQQKLHLLPSATTGIILKRQVHFLGQWIKHGGYYPIKLLRIWRNGKGSIEQRWMDEHIKVSEGTVIEFDHDIVDDNLNNLSWWTQKHNNYSTREAVDLLNRKYHFFEEDNLDSSGENKQQDVKKRWYKDNFYSRSPKFIRALAYFMFRYLLQLGFLDGKKGLIWHFLQGFWYRFLVDAKIEQIEYMARQQNKTVVQILTDNFGVKL